MEPWWERAECKGVENPDIFYLTDYPLAVRAALACCARCPVRRECREFNDELEAGLAPSGWSGIWAGERTEDRAIRRSGKGRVT